MATGSGKRRVSAAQVLLNVVLAAIFLTFTGLTLASAVRKANLDAEVDLVAVEARELYAAFEKFYERHREYPNAWIDRPFELETLDPLAKRGYYRGVILAKMRGRQADAYDSPDDRGQNREFWVEMTLALDPSIRVVVAKSDDAPLSGGEWLEGAYLWRNGELEPLR